MPLFLDVVFTEQQLKDLQALSVQDKVAVTLDAPSQVGVGGGHQIKLSSSQSRRWQSRDIADPKFTLQITRDNLVRVPELIPREVPVAKAQRTRPKHVEFPLHLTAEDQSEIEMAVSQGKKASIVVTREAFKNPRVMIPVTQTQADNLKQLSDVFMDPTSSSSLRFVLTLSKTQMKKMKAEPEVEQQQEGSGADKVLTTVNNFEIINALGDVPGFLGVFPNDALPTERVNRERVQSGVANLQNSDQGGSHWVAWYHDPQGSTDYFDPFGVVSTDEMREFLKLYSGDVLYNHQQVQDIDATSCGYHCINFIRQRSGGKSFYAFIEAFPESTEKAEDRLEEAIEQLAI